MPDRSFIGDMAALARLNPAKIYLENVRSVLGVSSRTAQRICDTAVRRGAFRKLVEVVCPNGAVVATAEAEESLPETVRCWTEENGNYEEVYLPTRKLKKSVFYQLNDDSASREPHAQPA